VTSEADRLVARLMSGEARALARAISIVEDRQPAARDIIRAIYPRAGRAPIVGVTGPPGAGKSTLVDQLAGAYRREGLKVGIIAVDPSSAFSGGAVLGDRIRMQRHSTDDGVFIRSMATRGHFGGLAGATVDVADLMDAAGCQVLIIETVGVGQDEVDVVTVADVVLVVLVPGLGDDIQTIKAGIMEIPDIFVLNKADRDGIDRLQADVKTMLSFVESPSRPAPRIVRTIATGAPQGADGIDLLHQTIAELLKGSDPARLAVRRRERSRERVLSLLRQRVLEWAAGPGSGGAFEQLVEEVAARAVDPYTAADQLLSRFAPVKEEP